MITPGTDHDANRREPGLVIPDPQTARTFGFLNVLFAGMILFQEYATGLMLVFAPVATDLVKSWQVHFEKSVEGTQRRRVEELEERATAATDDLEKAEYAKRIANEKAKRPVVLGSMSMGFEQLEDPTIRRYSWSDLASGVAVNVLMLGAGFGLLRLREWGRKLALGIAALKLLRIAALIVVSLVWIYPIQSAMAKRQMAEIEAQMQAQMQGGRRPPGFSPASMSQFIGVSSAASGMLFFVTAAAYPVLSLYFLSRPAVRAACRGRGSSPARPGDDDFEGFRP